MIGKTRDCIKWLLNQEVTTEWEVKPYKKARSNKQNAYYWVLLTEVADKMRMSKNELHNRMLRDYGQPFIIDGEMTYVMFPDTDEAEKELLNSTTYHVCPTSQTRPGDEHGYRAYRLLRGSSSYTTTEMSVLLDGLVMEAKQQGIETLTPDQLAHIKEVDSRNEKRKP